MLLYSTYTDEQLLNLLQNGEEKAFEEIYERYWGVLYMHAFKMLKQEEDVRDVLQEAFTTLWIKAKDLSHPTNLGGFLYITIRNRILDIIAQQKIRSNHLDSLTSYLEKHQDSIIESINQKEIMAALDHEIDQLPKKMKAILQMRVKVHLSNKEVAEELAISDKTVKKQISNAIKILNPKLSHLAGWIAALVYLFQK